MKNRILNIIKNLTQKLLIKKEYKDGIGVLICAKNEDHNISLCIESVIPFAKQIICVDHNSDDSTFEEMKRCKKKFGNQIDFQILQHKGPNLMDARNKGLQKIDRKWVLNAGGDFVFYEEDSNMFLPKQLSATIKNDKLVAVQFGFINLYGDLSHTYKLAPTCHLGEYYFFHNHDRISFKEDGKFDYLHFPSYFLRKSINKPLFFHLSGLKSDDRLLYRNCYFEWKKVLSETKGSSNIKKIQNFELFKQLWLEQLFSSNNVKSIKYRFQKQLVELNIQKYDENKFPKYPKTIKDLESGPQRFKIITQPNNSIYRVDFKDKTMHSYSPTKKDLDWNPDEYFTKYKKKDYLHTIKNKILSND